MKINDLFAVLVAKNYYIEFYFKGRYMHVPFFSFFEESILYLFILYRLSDSFKNGLNIM